MLIPWAAELLHKSLLVAALVAARRRGTDCSQQKCFALCKYCLEGGEIFGSRACEQLLDVLNLITQLFPHSA